MKRGNKFRGLSGEALMEMALRMRKGFRRVEQNRERALALSVARPSGRDTGFLGRPLVFDELGGERSCRAMCIGCEWEDCLEDKDRDGKPRCTGR